MHARDKKTRANIVTMNAALCDVFLENMSTSVRASVLQRRLSEPNIVFVDLFLWFVKNYGKTTAEDREGNRHRMAADWHPSDGFDSVIHRLFTGAGYASSAGYPMHDADIIDIGLHVIKRCGMYSKEYKQWIAREAIRPKIVETFLSFKTFWIKPPSQRVFMDMGWPPLTKMKPPPPPTANPSQASVPPMLPRKKAFGRRGR